MSRPAIKHAAPSMTRKGNEAAALAAVTLGRLDRLDARLISRCHGMDIAVVERMIEARRAREAARG